jgi:acetyltransferase-like isoleucine patch superfamily enzyme
LTLKDRVELGHEVAFVVNKEIVIEEDVNISSRVQFRDIDSHACDATERIAGMRPGANENRAIRVCRYAWIGFDAVILKGVTIGDGAIIGAKSVVVTDVPPYTVVMGNPARVIAKGLKPVSPGSIDSPPQES